VLRDPAAVAERVLTMITDGTVEAVDGTTVEVRAESICLHGDSPGAVAMANAVRDLLRANAVDIASFV
jgi:UPF0271 protein